MTIRLFWLISLAAATSACLGYRSPPRFGHLRPDDQPFEFHHDIHLYKMRTGMTVALVPDRRTNLVTVEARYRVGSSDDPPGRAGLAHLIEHLTFEARVGTEQASLADRLGEAALQHNAFTNHDVTHYAVTALSSRLSEVLELEAQRLEVTCAQLDAAVFSRERDVVLEEEAERSNPWSALSRDIQRQVWGEHHPYARSVGSREVAEATQGEACQFLGSHYTPDRLILVVTGDFDLDTTADQIRNRFSRVTRRSDTAPVTIQAAQLHGTRSRHRADIDDAVAFVFFPAPAWGSEDAVLHELALKQLRRAMAEADDAQPWITATSVATEGAGQARLLRVAIAVDDPTRLEAAAAEVFRRASSMFSDVSPYLASNLLGQIRNGYVEAYESFFTRGEWVADYLTYTHHYDLMAPELEVLTHVTLADADRYARARFIPERSHVALVEPSGKPATATLATVAAGLDPDLVPWRAPVDPSEAERPLPAPASRVGSAVVEMTLDNGLRVLLAPDPTSSLVDARLVLPQGSASDPPARLGRAYAAATLLEPNPDRTYTAGQAFLLGWGLSVGTQLDLDVSETSTVFTARGTSNRADWHVWRLLWLAEQCGYLEAAVKTFREDVARPHADDSDPAAPLIRQLLFGAGHPYATPPPARDGWSWLTADELERFHETHFAPRGATLIVTGGFELEAMRSHIRELFGSWYDSTVEPPVTLPAAQPVQGPSWVGTRDPSRTQVGLVVAFATSSDPTRDLAARRVLSEMVSERLRIIREGMGASYGVQAAYASGLGGGGFFVESELDPARAAKASAAIVSELEALRTGAGTRTEDFVRARRRALARVLADAAGVPAVADELEYVARRGLPVHYIDQLAVALSKLTPAEVAAIAAVDLDARRRVVSVSATPERLDAVMTSLGASEPRIFDKKRRTDTIHR